MSPYYHDASVTLFHGDCRELAPALAISADCVIADPAYAGVPTWETVELGPHYCLRDDCLKPIRADGLTTESVNTLYAPSALEKVGV